MACLKICSDSSLLQNPSLIISHLKSCDHTIKCLLLNNSNHKVNDSAEGLDTDQQLFRCTSYCKLPKYYPDVRAHIGMMHGF